MRSLCTIPVADEVHLSSSPASNLQRWNKDRNASPRVRMLFRRLMWRTTSAMKSHVVTSFSLYETRNKLNSTGRLRVRDGQGKLDTLHVVQAEQEVWLLRMSSFKGKKKKYVKNKVQFFEITKLQVIVNANHSELLLRHGTSGRPWWGGYPTVSNVFALYLKQFMLRTGNPRHGERFK